MPTVPSARRTSSLDVAFCVGRPHVEALYLETRSIALLFAFISRTNANRGTLADRCRIHDVTLVFNKLVPNCCCYIDAGSIKLSSPGRDVANKMENDSSLLAHHHIEGL